MLIRIRLTRKLALSMNGVDVSRLQVGDALELSDERAQMMIDQGWAERAEPVLPLLTIPSKPLRSN